MSETEPDRDHLEQTAFAHSPYPDSYLTTEPEYRQFWNDSRTGYIGYLQDRKYLHMIGGLIAPDDEREELLRQFTEYVDEHRYLASFFNIAENDRPLFQKYGYEATKFGENATIDLKGHTWSGKPYSWVRRQVSFVQRQGIVAREIDINHLSETERHDAFARLQQMNEDQLAERVLPHEIGLLEGRLYPDHFYRRRLFVAHPENEPDNWQAFVACTPMENGRGWATEMYRSQKEAVRGITPFLFVKLIDAMKEEGVEFVSLCMVPAVNCGIKTPGDSWKTRYFLTLWEKRLNFLFNVQGLYHFKSRFRPEFEPVYLCVKPRITNGSTLSFLKCCGVFQMHWSNFFRLLKSRKQRAEQD